MDDSTVLTFRRLGEAVERLTCTLKEFTASWDFVIGKSRSNNWLKMHGYPMRRRGTERIVTKNIVGESED